MAPVKLPFAIIDLGTYQSCLFLTNSQLRHDFFMDAIFTLGKTWERSAVKYEQPIPLIGKTGFLLCLRKLPNLTESQWHFIVVFFFLSYVATIAQ